ncbi:YcgJ family protein [Geminicoccaceae bacterium 1502E]|nr:YcgJ family protein [Geminicoccaceae bacterium 1502E]
MALAGCLEGGGAPYGPGYLSGPAYYDTADRSNRFQPRPGVSCDARSRVCYDRRGPDVGLTREYFGGSASKRLANDLDRRKTDPVYRPKDKVKCDLDDEVCYKKGEPDYKNTRQQFGRKAASEVREPGWKPDEIRPGKNVVCSTGDQACYKKSGEPAIGATRKVFGKKAAKELKED